MIKRFSSALAILAILLAGSVDGGASAQSQIVDSEHSRALVMQTSAQSWSQVARSVSSVGTEARVRDLGAGWFGLTFNSDVSQVAIEAALAAYRRSSLVKYAGFDLPVRPASTGRASALASRPAVRAARSIVLPAAALRVATPVLALRATNAFNPATPNTALLTLTWARPASTYGAVVTGYQVDMRLTAASWATIAQSHPSTSLVVSKGLVAGSSYQFRVRAITKFGASTAVGAFSRVVTAAPATAPLAPILTSPTSITKDAIVRWNTQSKADKGGLTVTYTAVASSSGQSQLSCTTTRTYCAIRGVAAGYTYQVAVTAKNSLGSATSSYKFTPQDAYYDQQWYLNSQYGIKADKAWQTTMGSPNVVVAVLDSGITKHPDLDSQVVAGYDFVSDPSSSNDGDGWDADPSDPGDYSVAYPTSSWHGTHVAGIIAASANKIGVIGVAPFVKVQAVRVLGSQGGQTSDIIAALHWAAGIHVRGVPDNPTPAKVVNMSMGTDSYQNCDTATALAVQDLLEVGVTMLTAAGNYATDAFGSYPGNCYGTINIGATGFTGDLASYSDFGLGVDISAPGGDSENPGNAPAASNGAILSTINAGTKTPGAPDYANEEGTSMATPIVAGVVALMYSVNPKITPAQVWDGIRSTASPFLPGSLCALTAGHTDRTLYSRSQLQRCGAGIVNAEGAVQYALATK
ncbi:MAG: hypothetical protein RLZZ626_895 [Actinomycetota bacterium]|jgi:serine protease